MKKYAEVYHMIDVHSHILPGVDDGAADMDETIAMLEYAIRDGITTFIATPHYHLGRKVADYNRIDKVYHDVISEVKERKLPIQIFLGNEIFCSDTAIEDISAKKVHTMHNSRYILLEFHPGHSYREIRHGIRYAIEEGYIPILAHAERYQVLLDDYRQVKELIDMGCYIQLNAGDIMGNDGWRVKHFCKKLLKAEYVHFIATDAHRKEGRRVPQLSKCAAYIARKYGDDYAQMIFEDNPQKILQDAYL